jgi:uncharacterized protein YqfA (UPF0365 family)
MPSGQTMAIAVTVVFLIVTVAIMAVLLQFFGLYARALMSGAPVPMVNLIGMKLRRVDARTVTDAWIQATRAQVDVTLPELESHLLSGGDVQHVMAAIIAAKQTGKELTWKGAAAMDLAQRDVVEYVASGAYESGQDWRSAPMRRRQPLI